MTPPLPEFERHSHPQPHGAPHVTWNCPRCHGDRSVGHTVKCLKAAQGVPG